MSSVASVGRLADLYRRTRLPESAIALVVANAIPLAGVLFLGWSLWTILVLYWVENGIVGLWNIPRILLARGTLLPAGLAGGPVLSAFGLGGSMSLAARGAIAGFFVVHYGVFWAVHGIFVMALPTFAGVAGLAGVADPQLISDQVPGFLETTRSTAFGEIAWSSVDFAAAILFISHGASFFLNYLGRGESLAASPATQVTAAYGRVVVLHLTILIGGFAIVLIGAPIGALVVLVVLKTWLDLRLHLRERQRLSAVRQPASA